MNNTAPDDGSGGGGGFLGKGNIGGFGYGIGVSVGILLLITTITLASYFCTRGQQPTNPSQQQRNGNNNSRGRQNDGSFVIEVGLDEGTIKSYPKLQYSESKLQKKDSTAMCCSICLADYKSSDMLRLLPDCNHMFHVKCVDPWLRLHPTCPVCRTSPLPTPLSTPLAEVVPLATRRD
ncbi:RING-H2 finger protein [Melia azedarach]|uniref:RING-H2 finger protein n=1 Tax=Melia azedarach TaxID=155640 RepID=A0ACC1X2Y8_MELAZ|nr:RING-H2 finger protein [Melia azedarach]